MPNELSPTTLAELAGEGLQQGVSRLKAAGSPLQSFLLDQGGKLCLLVEEDDEADPMDLACQAIRSDLPDTQRCALVVDTRITFEDDETWDAVLAMACERGGEGEAWVQRYVLEGPSEAIRLEGEPELIGASDDFISLAFDAV